MSVAAAKSWTVEEFFPWAESQDERYEFDGHRPVAMTGGNLYHAVITRNLHRALDARLRGSPCQYLGPDAGLATVGNAVRYPDALVTCSRLVGSARTVDGVIVAFEVISPTSGRVDRVTKVREYAAVPSVRRYVILESTAGVLLVLHRNNAADPWTALPLTDSDVLPLPEIGIEIPVAEFYEGVDFNEAAPDE